MKKLQQDIIDFCIENQDLSPKKVIEQMIKIMDITSGEKISPDHSINNWKEALGISEDISKEWSSILGKINSKTYETQSEYFEAIHNSLPKIALILLLVNMTKELKSSMSVESFLSDLFNYKGKK